MVYKKNSRYDSLATSCLWCYVMQPMQPNALEVNVQSTLSWKRRKKDIYITGDLGRMHFRSNLTLCTNSCNTLYKLLYVNGKISLGAPLPKRSIIFGIALCQCQVLLLTYSMTIYWQCNGPLAIVAQGWLQCYHNTMNNMIVHCVPYSSYCINMSEVS